MNTRLIYPLFLLFITLIAHPVHAEKVKLEFSATVNHVNDTGNVLSGSFQPGHVISGSYTFDSNVPDQDATIENAFYKMHAPLPAGYGYQLDLPGLSFSTSQTSASLDIHAYNGPANDHASFLQCCGAGSLSNGANVDMVFLDLFSPNGNINSASLDEILNNLAGYPEKHFGFHGMGANGQFFAIEATVDSITVDSASSCNACQDGNSVSFNAEVLSVYDYSNGLVGLINVGDMISGDYRFNPATPNSSPVPEHAQYHHTIGDPDSGISLRIAGDAVSSDPATTGYVVVIDDMPPNAGTDAYIVDSHNSAMRLANGSVINNVFVERVDPSATALNSVALTEAANSPLSAWPDAYLYFDGVHADGSFFSVYARLTSTESGGNCVPEVGPFEVSPGEGVFTRHQHFDAAIVLPPNTPAVINVDGDILINGHLHRPLNCHYVGTSFDNREVILCPSTSDHLQPGNNVVNLQVHLGDGTSLSHSVTWQVLE